MLSVLFISTPSFIISFVKIAFGFNFLFSYLRKIDHRSLILYIFSFVI